MKILIFNWRDITHPWAGGAELNIHEQAKCWVQTGHQVTLFCGEYPGGSRRANIDGIEIVRRGGRFTVYLWAVVYYLLYFRNKYDVFVDIENGIPFFTPLYSRIPKVCIAHHVHTEQFRKEFSPPLSQIGIFLESVVMPLVYTRTPFITVSKSSCEGLARIGINPEKCSVVYNGLDHDLYRPCQVKTHQPSLIYLGRLMRYKRIDLLVKLMVPIVEEFPEAVLHIVGSGPAENESRQMVKQCELDDHVIFHGHVSEAEKVSLLQQSWLLVVTSMKEGWGLVAIEANACGTPAVAFNVPGLCEAIDNPHSGLLADSEEDFVKKVVLLLRHDDLRARMSQNAQKHAGKFVWAETAAQTLRILSRAAKKEIQECN